MNASWRGVGRFAVLATALACAGRAQNGAEQVLAVRVIIDARELEFGAAFELRVVRSWSGAFEPLPFDESALAPLSVQRLGVDVVERGDGREETRRYRGHAFTPDVLVVPSLLIRAVPRAGGAPGSAQSDELRIPVRSALPAGDNGVPEPFGELLPLPQPRAAWPFVVVALLVVAGVVTFARRRPARTELPTTAVPAGPTALDLLLEALTGLRARAVADQPGEDAFCSELTAALRAWISRQMSLPAAAMTSEELLAHWSRRGQGALDAVLATCDRVKFAHGRVDAPARARLLDEVRALAAVTDGEVAS